MLPPSTLQPVPEDAALRALWPKSMHGHPTRATVLGLVGNTPVLDVTTMLGDAAKPGVRVYAKLESQNPAQSVKDRPAMFMILQALARGDVKAGGRLIEATSGNTGIALAMIAKAVGLEMHLVLPSSSTAERMQSISAYGAHLHLQDNMEACRDYAERLVAETADSENPFIMLNQFANQDNPLAHYETTGPELWEQTNGEISHFVSAMGTTGTVMGVSRFLKEKNPDVEIVGCHPAEGAKIPGIRKWAPEYLPKFYEPERVDTIVDISQPDAEDTARRLAKEVGLLSGISAGGACWAALEIAKKVDRGCIVFVLCDSGARYLSSGVFASDEERTQKAE